MEGKKVVLITGCSRGIGLGLVKEYVSRGHQVIATCRNPANATELNDFLVDHGQGPALPLDVTCLASIKSCLEAVEKDFKSLDILVNNAAIGNKDFPYELPTATDPQEFDDIMHSNVTSILSMTQAFLPLLKQAKGARVVNISSILGSISTHMLIAPTSYKCSKAAVNMLTKCFAEEVKDVVFIAMHPGWVQTDMGKGTRKDLSPPLTVEESVKGIVDQAQKVKQEDSGLFVAFDGAILPY